MLSHPFHLTNLPLKTLCLYLNEFYLLYNLFCFNYFIFYAVLSTSISYYLLLQQPNFPMGIIKVLSYLI